MRRVRRARPGVVLLGTIVVAMLTPLAYASPPDPSWIAGIYDDGDYDNIVGFATSCHGAHQVVAPADDHSLPLAGRVPAAGSISPTRRSG